METPAPAVNWTEYFEATLDKPLHPHYEALEPYLPQGGEALELGCGVGHGALHLLGKGFAVTAVDAEERALEILRSRLPDGSSAKLVQSRFQDLELGRYDLVAAHFCLFFLTPAEFEAFWPRVVDAIKPGGVFSGQFLGVNDEWRDRGYTVLTREQVENLLSDFEVLYFDEVERDGETSMGTPKHWHVFHVVARKSA